MMFIFQYHPNYRFKFGKVDDYVNAVICEITLHDFQFRRKYEFGFDEEDNFLSQSMTFGDIATDFLIRYCNYSLIKCSGQKIILTAQSDCHKRFEKLLSDGYSLQRRSKIGYIKTSYIFEDLYPEVKGFFYKLSVLPTREIGYPIDEIIETDDGTYEQVLQLSKN